MLEQALKFRAGFDKMAAVDMPFHAYFKEDAEGKKRIGPPSRADWEAVNKLVQFLIIFYKATIVLSASTSPCSHKLYHAIVTMTKNILMLSTTAGPDALLRTKASSMLGKLEKYWSLFDDKVDMNRLVMVAAVFDPRKKMKFVKGCFDKLYGKDSAESTHLCAEITSILRKMFDEYFMIANKSSVESVTSNSAQSNATFSQSQEQFVDEVSQRTYIGNGLQYESLNDLYNDLVQESAFREKADELDQYLKESVENPHVLPGTEYDVLSFWRVNSPKFPVLSLVARDILAMQVSSVASESAFSTSGRVLDTTRSCLTHYMIEVLMCTEQWLKCEIKVNDRGVTRKEHLLADYVMQDELMRGYGMELYGPSR
uniref:Zinc finger BED domain-containing protein RICESLEEPER 2 n=1 Tax=Noccaea caerulescens TaxID=107243 RepID=A0A1J3I878_NOCCA